METTGSSSGHELNVRDSYNPSVEEREKLMDEFRDGVAFTPLVSIPWYGSHYEILN
jgi:hypothetical protein